MKLLLHVISICILFKLWSCDGFDHPRNIRKRSTDELSKGVALNKEQIGIVQGNYKILADQKFGKSKPITEIEINKLALQEVVLTSEQEKEVLDMYSCYYKEAPVKLRSKRDTYAELCPDDSNQDNLMFHIQYTSTGATNVIQLVNPTNVQQDSLTHGCAAVKCQGADLPDNCKCRNDMKCRTVNLVGVLIYTSDGAEIVSASQAVKDEYPIEICSCSAILQNG